MLSLLHGGNASTVSPASLTYQMESIHLIHFNLYFVNFSISKVAFLLAIQYQLVFLTSHISLQLQTHFIQHFTEEYPSKDSLYILHTLFKLGAYTHHSMENTLCKYMMNFTLLYPLVIPMTGSLGLEEV